MKTSYRMCNRCVMDTSAEEITFNVSGICGFCDYFEHNVKPILIRATQDKEKIHFKQITDSIKSSRAHGKYDSILGISGGVDSSYLACIAIEAGLKPLAIHIDTGWNTAQSTSNVKSITDSLKVDLEIISVDWYEMVDLQLAFYKASVKNCEIPQDHAFLAALYDKAAKEGIKYILTGGNLATESILPASWGYNAGDLRHMLSIHRQFGSRPLRNFPMLSFWKRYFYYPFIKGVREIRLLDYIPYKRFEAKEYLINKLGWRDYGAKHYESVLTRFFQGYYLPMKFGIDKRRAHYSSMILSGQMTREAALEQLKEPPYPSEELLEEDKKYIAQKLGISLEEWESILALPQRRHEEFPSSKMLFMIKDKIVEILGIRRRRYGL